MYLGNEGNQTFKALKFKKLLFASVLRTRLLNDDFRYGGQANGLVYIISFKMHQQSRPECWFCILTFFEVELV